MSTCPLPPFLTSATWGPQDSARVSGASSAFASSATGFGGGKEFNGVDPSAVQFSSVRFDSVLFGSVQLSSVRFGLVQLSLVRFGLVQLSSVRFGLVQLSLVRFGSVRFSSVQLSSVLDGIYALGKAQCAPSRLCGIFLLKLSPHGIIMYAHDLFRCQRRQVLKPWPHQRPSGPVSPKAVATQNN